MNRSDEDIDLRLALGSRNYSVDTRLNSSSGAGVNADSPVDMPFAASDPLSELVWSPHRGLSLKCADPGFPGNRAFLTWRENADENLTSRDIRLGSAGEAMLDEATGLRSSGGSASYGGSKGGLADKAITADATIQQGIAESSKMNAELHTDLVEAGHDRKSETAINWKFPSNLLRGRLERDASRSGVVGSAVPIRSEPLTAKVSEALVCSLPNLQACYQVDDEVTSASSDVHKTKTDAAALLIPSPTLVNVESSAENDLGHLAANEARSLGEAELPREDPLPVDIAPTSSRICLYQGKGKGKGKGKERASSDGDKYGRSSSNDDDDSHKTVESCSSAGLFPKGVKRRHDDDQGQEIGSKRVKKYLQESPGSTSVVKADSSFMKWISNMVKGLSDSNKEEPSLLALTLARSNNVCSYETTEFAKPRTGFQNVFQSLYCQTSRKPISGAEKDSQFVAESRELMVADRKLLDKSPEPCNRNSDSPCKQIILSDQEATPHVSKSPVKPWIFSADYLTRNPSEYSRKVIEGKPSGSLCRKADIPLPMSSVPEKSRPLPSLWITRLYTKTAQFENSNRIADEALDCNSENDVSSSGKKASEARDDCGHASESVDLEFSHKQSTMQPFEELRSSEAMASVFAKRLDALRHIMHPSGRRSPPTFPLTCFFCGSVGHDLRRCPELTDAELENLLVNTSSFDRVDGSPSFCIRCFQLDHWAISCPSAPSPANRRSKQKAAAVELQTTSRLQPSADDRTRKFAGEVDCSRKPVFGSFLQKRNLSISGNILKDKQMCKLFDAQQEEVFRVIRRLRLSRADVLRWMDSDVSLSHLNGFFLRLRLGKMEGELDGTGYYVACITGDSIENIGCKSKKSVLVDVGGLKSSVGSQYISNHDFLEEEIKGWWSRIVKTGGKIPCLDELKSKFESRECLGL